MKIAFLGVNLTSLFNLIILFLFKLDIKLWQEANFDINIFQAILSALSDNTRLLCIIVVKSFIESLIEGKLNIAHFLNNI